MSGLSERASRRPSLVRPDGEDMLAEAEVSWRSARDLKVGGVGNGCGDEVGVVIAVRFVVEVEGRIAPRLIVGILSPISLGRCLAFKSPVLRRLPEAGVGEFEPGRKSSSSSSSEVVYGLALRPRLPLPGVMFPPLAPVA